MSIVSNLKIKVSIRNINTISQHDSPFIDWKTRTLYLQVREEDEEGEDLGLDLSFHASIALQPFLCGAHKKKYSSSKSYYGSISK